MSNESGPKNEKNGKIDGGVALRIVGACDGHNHSPFSHIHIHRGQQTTTL
jgi:hypothetical protein